MRLVDFKMSQGAVLIADARESRDEARDHVRCSKLNAVHAEQNVRFHFNPVVIGPSIVATVSPLCELVNNI